VKEREKWCKCSCSIGAFTIIINVKWKILNSEWWNYYQ